MLLKIILPIIVCFIPVILCFIIFKKMQVKALNLALAIILGLVAVVPISFIQYVINQPPLTKISLIIYQSFILYGLIEEGMKALLIAPLPGKKDENSLKFLLVAFMFGITLGSFESVVYYLDKLEKATNRGANLLYFQIFLRMFSSCIIHMTCAGISGLFIWTIAQKKPKYTYIIYPVFIHGLYDFFVAFQNNFKWFAIAAVLLAIAECRTKYTSLLPKED